MPTIRQRFANYLLGDERARLQNGIEALAELRHYVRSPAEQLGELDSQLTDLLLSQSGFTRIGGSGAYGGLEQIFSEQMRQTAVRDSRWMYHNDVMMSAAVDMWTDFGFGQHVTITPADKTLAEVFDEFWTARRNRPVLGDSQIHENSNRIVADGEIFLAVWVSTLDGTCTIRRINTDRIADIICDPDDPETPLWYAERSAMSETLYYADWRTTPAQLDRSRVGVDGRLLIPADAKLADDLRENTRVVIVPVQRNRIGKRGWPQMRQALVWARAYKDFIGDRATVAKKAAMYVEKAVVKNAGQRQIDNIVRRLESSMVHTDGPDSNQNTTAGQTRVQNENIDFQWMNRDTGASAAQIDGLTILGQFSGGARVPSHWLGRPDAMQNRAVAKESSLPFYEQIQRYQSFWISSFSDLAEVVGRFANEYGDTPEIEDFSVEVGMDSPFSNDVDEIASIMGAIGAATSGGQLPRELAEPAMLALVRLALQSLGIRNADKVLIPIDAPVDDTPDDDGGLPELYAEALRLSESVNEVLREYDDVLTRWGADVLNGRMDKIEYRRKHKAAIADFGKRAYEEGLREDGADPGETTETDAARLLEWIDDQRGFVNAYADWLVSEDDGKRNTADKRNELGDRVEAWAASLRNLAQIAEASAEGDPLIYLDGKDGEKDPCDECQEFSGEDNAHRLSWWEKRDLLRRNGNENYTCGRWSEHCLHKFRLVKNGKVIIE